MTKPTNTHLFENVEVPIPHAEDDRAGYEQLPAHAVLGVVGRLDGRHDGVHHEEVEGVQGADVVQDVRVAHGHAQQDHEEVEPPQHLEEADGAVVALFRTIYFLFFRGGGGGDNTATPQIGG